MDNVCIIIIPRFVTSHRLLRDLDLLPLVLGQNWSFLFLQDFGGTGSEVFNYIFKYGA